MRKVQFPKSVYDKLSPKIQKELKNCFTPNLRDIVILPYCDTNNSIFHYDLDIRVDEDMYLTHEQMELKKLRKENAELRKLKDAVSEIKKIVIE